MKLDTDGRDAAKPPFEWRLPRRRGIAAVGIDAAMTLIRRDELEQHEHRFLSAAPREMRLARRLDVANHTG